MAKFLLMLQSDRAGFDSMDDDAKKAQIMSYNKWVGGLVERGVFRDGMGFQTGHVEITPNLDVSAPISGGVVAPTGQFVIEVETMEEAIEIGKTCPALKCGETVQVFKLGGAG